MHSITPGAITMTPRTPPAALKPKPKARPMPKPKGLIFMAADAKGRVGVEHRRTIRSHVMRGKNTGKDASRHRRLAQLADVDGTDAAEDRLGAHDGTLGLPNRQALVHCLEAPPASTLDDHTTRRQHFFVPRTPHDLSLVKFCEDLDPTSRGKIVYFCTEIKKIVYPVARCCSIEFTDTYFFSWLLTDPAYLHATLYTVSVFFDVLAGRAHAHARATNYHLYRTLKALKRRVGDTAEALTDATVAVVMALTLVAEAFGDVRAAATHFQGLRQMVEVRGGIEAFSHNGELYSKCCRVDFVISLSTGAEPAFAGTMLSFAPFFRRLPELAAALVDSAPGFAAVRSAVRSLDPGLAAVLQDMHDFSQTVNAMTATGESMHPRHFNDLVTSAQYRLLDMDFIGHDRRFAELLRLSLLAYLATLFLKVPRVRTPFHFVGVRMRSALAGVEPATGLEHRLYGWCLVMGAITVLPDPGGEWLQSRLAAVVVPCFGTTWPEVQDGLRQVAWIDSTHGEAGAEVVCRHLAC